MPPSSTWWATAIVLTAVALACAPYEVNGDGIGYLKAARDGAVYPGHLGYVPLLRLFELGQHGLLADDVFRARLVSALGAGIACALLGAYVARRTDRARALLVALGLFSSAGLFIAGSDIESYAPATAAIIATLVLIDRGSHALAGVTLALAILFHVENVLFVLPAFMLSRSRSMLLVAGVLVGLAYALHPGLLAATHGFRYPLHAWTPLVAIWGALRALCYAPYPYEASIVAVALPTLYAIGVAIVLSTMIARASRVVLAWLIPYTIVGASFFASDSERWIFLLPLLWILVSRASQRRLALVVALLVVGDVASWMPHALDRRDVDRARAAAATLRTGDLVVSPGHGWDESIALYANVRTFPIVFFAASRGGLEGLAHALDEELARSPKRVVAIRMDDDSPLGWKELALLGLGRDQVTTLLASRGITWSR